jgi:hypothetical protein
LTVFAKRKDLDDGTWRSGNIRLTWQASTKNKISFYYDHNRLCQCPYLIGATYVGINAPEGATLARIEPFYSWNTPIAWTGFILFADSIVWRARKRSWMRSNPAELVFLAVVSIPLWLVFEFYNLSIDNWYYTGLPANFWLRQFGYAWSFATIWPAIFEAADLIEVWRPPTRGLEIGQRDRYVLVRANRTLMMAAGAAMLLWPLVSRALAMARRSVA